METRIKKIIKKELKAKVEKIEKITEGFSHENYLVKLNKKPREVVIRFSNNIIPDASLLKEKFVLDLLRKNSLPTPKVYAFYFPK